MNSQQFTLNRMYQRTARQRGFTLVEALIAMTVAGILLAVGLPQLSDYAAGRAVRAKVSALSGAMRLARTEAVKRGTRVTVCPTTTANAAVPTCSAGNQWETGWVIFSDRGVPNVIDAGLDQVIRIQNAFSDNGSILSNGAGVAVNFFPNGVAVGGQREFVFQPVNATAPQAAHFSRRLCQTAAGSSRVIKFNEAC
ncbi:MAG: GspH/FimT family pseudopilin [Burkholderiaceae bacterium]